MAEKPKQFTKSRQIYECMDRVYKSGRPLNVSNIYDEMNRKIDRNLISVKLCQFSSLYFNGAKFFLRTVNGQLILGCYQLPNSDQAGEF